ncbi:MAG TPA: uroporphyrinogen decarboxylase family protein [Candidatus Brocadiia bacterium]|nr:uroporphyrinogen decarboxylase family protein [Candidatus Brocadiia bacterium]
MPCLLPHIPLAPDINRILDVLRRRPVQGPVPLFELMVDQVFVEAMLGEPLVAAGLQGDDAFWAFHRNAILFWHGMGYDYYFVRGDFGWPLRHTASAQDTASISKGQRAWVQQECGVITNRDELSRYPWPVSVTPDAYDFIPRLAEMLPSGMGLAFRASGVLENLMWLMGYEGSSFALADDPGLFAEVAARVGSRALELFAAALRHPQIRFVLLGDDLGFKTQTLLPPAVLRQHIFPWQKKLVDLAHSHNAPFVLHACGALHAIMDDLIDNVGIDAKHSYEDAIEPVAQAKKKYGHRIAILGGVDVDKLARWEEAPLRQYVRDILAACVPGGGYALGSGNSIANYVSTRNYLAMLDEGRRWNNA